MSQAGKTPISQRTTSPGATYQVPSSSSDGKPASGVPGGGDGNGHMETPEEITIRIVKERTDKILDELTAKQKEYEGERQFREYMIKRYYANESKRRSEEKDAELKLLRERLDRIGKDNKEKAEKDAREEIEKIAREEAAKKAEEEKKALEEALKQTEQRVKEAEEAAKKAQEEANEPGEPIQPIIPPDGDEPPINPLEEEVEPPLNTKPPAQPQNQKIPWVNGHRCTQAQLDARRINGEKARAAKMAIYNATKAEEAKLKTEAKANKTPEPVVSGPASPDPDSEAPEAEAVQPAPVQPPAKKPRSAAQEATSLANLAKAQAANAERRRKILEAAAAMAAAKQPQQTTPPPGPKRPLDEDEDTESNHFQRGRSLTVSQITKVSSTLTASQILTPALQAMILS
ncbi:MAG: hypothetical protein M1814_004332 [Vezdaea aestivalis]|nr:MAG: hypothetical protein M1814_004332 [Vezdaea aestivalis]